MKKIATLINEFLDLRPGTIIRSGQKAMKKTSSLQII
jgi:hypothetical protein